MKKMRKGKKMLLIMLVAIIAIIAIAIIINLVKKEPSTPGGSEIQYEPVVQLKETTYSVMEVKNIQAKYLKDNNETVLSMNIHNTTTEKVENNNYIAILIGPNEEILGQMDSVIPSIDVGQEINTQVVYDGDFSAVKQIKLIEK